MRKVIGLIIVAIISLTKTVDHQATINDVSARSAILMDAGSGRVMFQKNIHERLLTASIAKIMTAITAIEHLDLECEITVTKDVLKAHGSSIYLEIGDRIKIIDLLYGLMLRSGNDAALMIALSYNGNESDFVRLMNEKAKQLKMTNSTFENPSGLDETTKNYSTAYDMAVLMRYALQNTTFRMIISTKHYVAKTASGKILDFYNKHRLVCEHPQVTGGKTGYTKLAGRTLVTSFQNKGMEVIVVTFDAGGDWNIHKSLANYAFENFKNELIISRRHFKLATCLYSFDFFLERDVYLPLKEGDEVYLGLYLKPESKKNKGLIGQLNVYLNNELILRVPVYQ
jgi:D-alanyl-D-alanine carboxypeptidase (penicillin-binding protein 5/6)